MEISVRILRGMPVNDGMREIYEIALQAHSQGYKRT